MSTKTNTEMHDESILLLSVETVQELVNEAGTIIRDRETEAKFAQENFEILREAFLRQRADQTVERIIHLVPVALRPYLKHADPPDNYYHGEDISVYRERRADWICRKWTIDAPGLVSILVVFDDPIVYHELPREWRIKELCYLRTFGPYDDTEWYSTTNDWATVIKQASDQFAEESKPKRPKPTVTEIEEEPTKEEKLIEALREFIKDLAPLQDY